MKYASYSKGWSRPLVSGTAVASNAPISAGKMNIVMTTPKTPVSYSAIPCSRTIIGHG